jgi:nucleoside-diphosphate kinase
MMQKTLIIIKPHAVERGLVGTFLNRFENMGLKISNIKAIHGSPALWERFYPSDEKWLSNAGSKTLENCKANGINVMVQLGTTDPIAIGRMIKEWLVNHMSSGISIAAIIEGNEALKKVRVACGSTLPNMASPGTIRFDFSSDSPSLANKEMRPVFNLIHSSDPDEMRGEEKSYIYEIKIIFPEVTI